MTWSVRNPSFRCGAERRAGLLLAALASVSAGVLLLIGVFLWLEAWPALRAGGWQRFVAAGGWHPLEQQFGMLPMLAGTVLLALGAVALAGLLGLACALFVRFYAPARAAVPLQRLLEMMAGIPSVVYGLWGLTVLVPLIAARAPPGASLLAGILIVAMMVLPTVALLSDAALRAVPSSYVAGAYALGMSKTGTVLQVVLPAARGGIIGAVLLAAGRAVGETMAVIMVAGNIVQLPSSVFDPVRVLTANIAMEMAYAVGEHRASLFVSGLVLILIGALLAAMAAPLAQRRVHG